MWAYSSRIVAFLAKANVLENKVFCGEFVAGVWVRAPVDLELIEGIVGIIHLLIHRSVDSGEPKPAPVHRDKPFWVRLRYLLKALRRQERHMMLLAEVFFIPVSDHSVVVIGCAIPACDELLLRANTDKIFYLRNGEVNVRIDPKQPFRVWRRRIREPATATSKIVPSKIKEQSVTGQDRGVICITPLLQAQPLREQLALNPTMVNRGQESAPHAAYSASASSEASASSGCGSSTAILSNR